MHIAAARLHCTAIWLRQKFNRAIATIGKKDRKIKQLKDQLAALKKVHCLKKGSGRYFTTGAVFKSPCGKLRALVPHIRSGSRRGRMPMPIGSLSGRRHDITAFPIHINPYLGMFACLPPAYLLVCLPACLSTGRSVDLSIEQSIHLLDKTSMFLGCSLQHAMFEFGFCS